MLTWSIFAPLVAASWACAVDAGPIAAGSVARPWINSRRDSAPLSKRLTRLAIIASIRPPECEFRFHGAPVAEERLHILSQKTDVHATHAPRSPTQWKPHADAWRFCAVWVSGGTEPAFRREAPSVY